MAGPKLSSKPSGKPIKPLKKSAKGKAAALPVAPTPPAVVADDESDDDEDSSDEEDDEMDVKDLLMGDLEDDSDDDDAELDLEEDEDSEDDSEDSEDEDEDAEDAAAAPSSSKKPQSQSAQDAALDRVLSTFALTTGPNKVGFFETLVLTAEKGLEVPDVEDDLTRELEFYKQSLWAVQAARAKFEAASLPFSRPEDYFAEMVKTDHHMSRIRQSLLDEQSDIKHREDARKLREGKKFGKSVQVEKRREREKDRRDLKEGIERFKKRRKTDNGAEDEFDVEAAMQSSRERKKEFSASRGRGGGSSGGRGGFAGRGGGRGGSSRGGSSRGGGRGGAGGRGRGASRGGASGRGFSQGGGEKRGRRTKRG